MRKILAIFLAVVMTFAMVVPAVAVDTVNTSEETSVSQNENESAVPSVDTFMNLLQKIYDVVHKIVHTISKMFKFECPFCHGKDDSTTPDSPSDTPSDDDSYEAVEITAAELAKLLTVEYVDNCATVELDNNYKVVDEWTSLTYPVDSYKVRLTSLTFNGNGHIIAGLTAPLFAHNVAQNITVKDLTIADSEIASGDENGLGRGAFIACADSTVLSLSFENCAVKNSSVTADKSAGAFVGYAAQNDFTVKNCTVNNCKINAKKSAGGIVGFYMTDSTKTHIVEDTKVINCEISGEYVGQIAGTVNNNGEFVISGCEFSGDAVDPERKFATVTIK